MTDARLTAGVSHPRVGLRLGHVVALPGRRCAQCGEWVEEGRYAGRDDVVHQRCWGDWMSTPDPRNGSPKLGEARGKREGRDGAI